METTKQQITTLLNKSRNVLVATPENINGDALGGALALASAIEKTGRKVQVVAPEELPEKFKFLPIKNSLSCKNFQEREFILSIKSPKNHINNLSYQKKDGLLHIYLNAKNKIKDEDIRILNSHPFDLIFSINNQDFEGLGKIFEHNPELFFETPLVNIDNHIANSEFGEINLVDITSSSVSEIIIGLIDFIDRNLLNENVATYSLAGLIDATDNFRSQKTNPRTFNNAALLINRGGDREKITRYFYKTKSLNLLKLWGRILHKLSWDKQTKLVYGIVAQKDFAKTNTNPDYLPKILEEIKTTFNEINATLLLWEDSEMSKGIVYSSNPIFLKNLTLNLSGVLKNNNLFFSENKTLEETQKRILNLIKKEI